MPGLFGLLDSHATADIDAFLDRAQTAISHFDWYTADRWRASDASVGLGRSTIGIFNREAQPIISSDGNLILFMAGELYRTKELRKQLDALNASHAELALLAYQAFGADFASKLEGAFIIAVYNREQKRLVLTNDRFGQYPTYVYCEGGRLAFAPEVKGVLCAPFVPRKLNITAVAEYLRFQQLLETKTFHEGIEQFPYASVGKFDVTTGEWRVHRYWDWDHIPPHLDMTFEEGVREGGRLLREAVQELSSDELRPGVFLSGGLDSRAIVGFLTPRTPPPVTAAFGQLNSRDVYYAGKIAQAVGSQHHWFDLKDGRWVTDHVDLHLKLTEGFTSWLHMHSISMLPQLRGLMDYNLTGWDGGTVMGHRQQIRPHLNSPVDDTALTVTLFQEFVSLYTWPGMNEAEERLIYTPEMGKQAIGRAFDSLAHEFKRYQAYRLDNRAEYFYVRNHCFRQTQNMVTTARSHVEMRFPFWDYRLIEFEYSVRPEIRDDQMMYRHILTRELPTLANIPYDKQEFLPTVDSLRHKVQALSVRARRRLKMFPNRSTLYADYENYLRKELRGWAEGILYDKRTQERGILNVDFVRTLMQRHLSGYEEWTIGKIAPLITFEMMMRQYFD